MFHRLRAVYFERFSKFISAVLPNRITKSASSYYSYPKFFTYQARFPSKESLYIKYRKTDFPNQQLCMTPIVLIFSISVLQIGTILLGVYLRFWWMRLSDFEQQAYKKWLGENKKIFIKSFGIASTILFIYYISHLKKDRLTNHKHFTMLNKEEEVQIGNIILVSMLTEFRDKIVPRNNPIYERLLKLMERLAKSNEEVFEETEWSITILDMPLHNAVVLPGGKIIVFSGIFDVCQNDDQLIFILAHELSHMLLLHSSELFSYNILRDVIHAVPTILIWACFSTWNAILLHVGSLLLYKITFLYPFRRRMELEADEAGFKLAAKSCADLREILVYWKIVHKISNVTGEVESLMPWWLSTHPNHKVRGKKLTQQLPLALKLREQQGCPPLPMEDPREKFDELLFAEKFLRRKRSI